MIHSPYFAKLFIDVRFWSRPDVFAARVGKVRTGNADVLFRTFSCASMPCDMAACQFDTYSRSLAEGEQTPARAVEQPSTWWSLVLLNGVRLHMLLMLKPTNQPQLALGM